MLAVRKSHPLHEGHSEADRSTILVVDDHRPNLVALEAVLAPLGQTVQQASSGIEALRLLEERDFAVALLDVRMPGLSGLEVAARLRERGISTPIIFLTAAQESTDLRSRGYDRGAVDFILKPFDPDVLRAKVRVFVELHQQSRESERLMALHDAERLAARKRIQILAALTARLSRWLSTEDVAALVTKDAHDALQATVSTVHVLSEVAPELTMVTSRGVDPDAISALERLPLELDHPITAAVKAGETTWLESSDALLRALSGSSPSQVAHAAVALPLVIGARTLGAITFVFDAPQTWDTLDKEFLATLATQFAGAFERSSLVSKERAAKEFLRRQTDAMRFMADVGTLLSSSLEYDQILRQLTQMMVPIMADWCAVDVLGESGKIARLIAFHSDPSKIALAHELEQRYPEDPNAERGVPNVLRSGQTEWMEEIPDALLDIAARDGEHLSILRQLGLRSYVIVPLRARGRILGALSLIYAESGRHYSEDEVRYIEELAGRAALSVDNALLFQEQVDARDRLERQSRQALLAGDIGTALTSSDTLEKALQQCSEAIVRHLGAAFARIWTLDARASVLELRASAGLYTHLDGPHARVPVGQFKIGRIAERGTPHLTNEVQQDPWVSDREWARREGMVSFAGYPLIIEGTVIGVMALFARKPLADDTLSALSSIADAVAMGIERTRADNEAQKLITQLDKSNKELDQFAYVASHDLKAPLRGIANLSQWLEEDLGDVITPQGKQQLELMRNRVHRMEGLINGILDYSRAGRVRSKPELVAVDKLLAEVIELSSAPPGARVDVGPGMPELRTERIPLQQVFMNLVNNGLKHAKKGDPHLLISVSDAGTMYEFSVTDDGPGIAPEYHERIWGIFQTLEPRDTVEGTGVGLSVVKKIVEAKGGRAWLDSREGAGARFSFTWPKAEIGARAE